MGMDFGLFGMRSQPIAITMQIRCGEGRFSEETLSLRVIPAFELEDKELITVFEDHEDVSS